MLDYLAAHRFRVDFGGLEVLSHSVVKCDLSITQKTIALELFETVDGTVLECLNAIVEQDVPFVISLHLLKKKTNETLRGMFIHGMRLVEHQFVLAHSGTDVATHNCVFSFDGLSSKT